MVETTHPAEADRVVLRPAPKRGGVPAIVSDIPNTPKWPGLTASIGAALEQRRLFVLLPFAMIAGLIMSLVGETSAELWAVAATGLTLPVALFLLRSNLAAFRIAVLATAFWAGFALLQVHGLLFGTQMLGWPTYGTFEARVDEISLALGGVRDAVVSQITRNGEGPAVPMRRAALQISGGPEVSRGEIIRAPIYFRPVPGPVVPGRYDPQFHSYFDGIGAYGKTTGDFEVVRQGDQSSDLIEGVRYDIAARIDAVLAQPAAGLARSMMIGDQDAITDETREAMADSGLAHIYSISGLHLSIVAGGTLVVLRLALALIPGLGRWVSIKKIAAVGAIAAAVSYLLLAGGSSNVPAFRSTIMIALIFGAILVGRRALTMRNVAIAAGIIIVTDPTSVLGPSFQLSFAAVVALIGTYELVRSNGETRRGAGQRVVRIVGATAMTSLVAGAATLLFSAYHFQQTAPLGLVANLMSLVLIGPIMLSIVLAMLAMPLGLEAPFLRALGWLLDDLIWIAEMVSQWSAGFALHPLLTPVALVMGLAALGWFAFLQNRYRLIGPALLVPAVLIFALDRPPDGLISDTTQAVAIRTPAGLRLIDGKEDSFAVDAWSDFYGEQITAVPAKCDALACIAESSAGFKVAIVKDPAGFFEECGSADLIITRRNAPQSCSSRTVIDATDLRVNGVHWLRWTGDGFDVRPAITDVRRPWRAAQ